MARVVAAFFHSWQVTTLAACVAFQRFDAARSIAGALSHAAAFKFEASSCKVLRKAFLHGCVVRVTMRHVVRKPRC